MDITKMTGGETPPNTDRTPAVEYTAQVASPVVNGEAKLTIGENGLLINTTFDAAELPFTDMTSVSFSDYTVTIGTLDGNFVFSRMGAWTQPFYGALFDAYNEAVKKALFIKGLPLVTARAEYRFEEGGKVITGTAPAFVYVDCVCVLPSDTGARRIPLCFLTGMKKGDYELMFEISGDSYTLRKMGYDTDPFTAAVEKQLRAMREKTLTIVRELDASLTPAQATAITRQMPHGAAALIGQLNETAPSFFARLENKLRDSRAAESYKAFCELCDPSRIYIGFKKDETPDGSGGIAETPGGPAGGLTETIGAILGDSGGAADTAVDAYMLWFIVPSPDGKSCAVEFAGDKNDAAATFVYSFDCDFPTFARRLNMALEAINFKREVISLTDGELLKPEYSHYRMAVQRNAALKLVRASIIGRVIHNGSWRQKLTELWSGAAAKTSPEIKPERFCTSCGAVNQPGARFCGKCGAAQ